MDNTRLFISLTAGAGTRCMSLLSSSPILLTVGNSSCNHDPAVHEGSLVNGGYETTAGTRMVDHDSSDYRLSGCLPFTTRRL